ncbi:MAG: F0F1 ATP synthase subunit A [Vicingaceae bacterium]
MNFSRFSFILSFALILFTSTLLASEAETGKELEEKKFNPAELILHHISDAHEWHLWGETAIYLPVILKTDNGIEVFSSSHFYHNPKEIEFNGTNYHYYQYKNYILFHEQIYLAEDENNPLVFNEEGHLENKAVLDFSITKNTLTLFIVVIIMLLVFVSTAKKYKSSLVPKGIAKFMEPLILFIKDDIAIANIGEKKYEKFLPYLLTVFFFIWFSNLLGLIPVFPGGANLTGNIAVTAVLALITMIITNINGSKHYWGHIFAMPGVPKFVLLILTPVEILGIFTKPFALAIRLFANITAGHIVVLSLVSIVFIFKTYFVSPVSIVMTLFISCLELLVAFIQAYVFTLLSALFIGMAVDDGHH